MPPPCPEWYWPLGFRGTTGGKAWFLPQGAVPGGGDRQLTSMPRGCQSLAKGKGVASSARQPRKAFTQEGKVGLAFRDIPSRDRSYHGYVGTPPRSFSLCRCPRDPIGCLLLMTTPPSGNCSEPKDWDVVQEFTLFSTLSEQPVANG